MPIDLLNPEQNLSKSISFLPLTESATVPKYSKPGDAGMDIYSDEDVILDVRECKTISSGVRIKLPGKTVGFVTPRSGMASKFSVTVGNAPGTIDSSFCGELKVILINNGTLPYTVKKGDRIAQLVVVPFISCDIVLEKDFNKFNTERGSDGFGSSGR